MTCQSARNRILAVEEPDQLPDELAAHVEDCAACKARYQKYLLVERALPALPVPVADGLGKIAVLEMIRAMPAPAKAPESTSPPKRKPESSPHASREAKARPAPAPSPTSTANHKPSAPPKPMPLTLEEDLPKKRGRSFGQLAAQFWPAGLVAATLLVGVVAWLTIRGNKEQPRNDLPADPFLDNLVKHNVDLAKTQTPAERVAILAKVADDLNQEMRDIARADATGENMQALEEMYRRVVLNGLVAQAKLVERTQREAVLAKIADGLAQAGQRAEQTAAEAPQHSADRLREAAMTAREGTKKIRAFIKEAAL